MPNERFGKRGADPRSPEELRRDRQERIMELAAEINQLENKRRQLLAASLNDLVHEDGREISQLDADLALKRAELEALKGGKSEQRGR